MEAKAAVGEGDAVLTCAGWKFWMFVGGRI